MAVRGSKRARRQPAKVSAVDLVTQLRKEMVLNHGEFSRHLSGLRNEHDRNDSAITLCRDRLNELEGFFGDPYGPKPCLRDVPAAVASLQELTEETAEQVTTLQRIAKKSVQAGSVMADLAAQIDHTNARLDKFERGLDQLLEQVAGAMPPRPEPKPKPTIKGGWVNVYVSPDPNSMFRGSFTTFYDTKEAADAAACDNRIACIVIPDITEGDGL